MTRRVLHLGKYFPPHRGGMETYLATLLDAQCRAGDSVTCVVHRSEQSLRSRREHRDVAGTPGYAVFRAGRWLTLVFTPISPLLPWLVWRLLRRWRPTAVHAHLPNLSAFWLLLLPLHGAKLVLHWQADIVASEHSRGLRTAYPLIRPLERLLLRRADRIIVSSPPYLQASTALAPWRQKCRVVPLAIDDTDTVATPPVARESQNPLRVVTVGRLSYYKGINVLIDAVAQVPDVELVVVGDGDQRRALESQVANLALGQRVRFLGDVDSAVREAELRRAHVFCLPSIERTEAFGIALLEAMRAARPCIVTHVPGTGMAWVAGDTGWTVAPNDPGAIAALLRDLLDQPEYVRRGEQARLRFETLFRVDADHVAAINSAD